MNMKRVLDIIVLTLHAILLVIGIFLIIIIQNTKHYSDRLMCFLQIETLYFYSITYTELV